VKSLRFLLIAFSLTVVVGCKEQSTASSDTQPAAQSGKRLRVGLMPKLVGIGFFNAFHQGAQEAAAELGADLVFEGPTVQSHDLQVQKIETWIAKKFDVIGVSANDPAAMAPTIQKARDRGIHVITYDADCENSAREYFVNQATYDAIAKSLMDIMHEAIGDEGKYVILTGNLTAFNQNIWMERMKAYREKTYPKMVDLSEGKPYETKEDRTVAKRVCMDVLDARGSELQGIFAITSTALPGAAEAVADKNAKDKVFLTGLATPDEMRQYVKSDVVKKFALWSPVDLGYLTMHVAKLLAEGKMQEGTIEAGRLKTISVKGKEVLFGEPVIFTKDNIDQYHF
jgi:rhamnose transport system substrate-binding protein